MKILSLDSTAIVSTVAICENERLLAQFTINNGNTHSETLLPMIEASLKVLKLTVDDIDLFACSAGPGSFTGVRIGASTVKGLAFNKNKPCAPVSSLDALAHNLHYADGIVCPVMNARRGQLYNALFLCENGKLTRLCEDRALMIDDVLKDLAEIHVKSPETPIYAVGDGAELFVRSTEGKGVPVKLPPEHLKLQRASSVCFAAENRAAAGDTVDPDKLLPVYLRLPQAERELKKKQEAAKQ